MSDKTINLLLTLAAIGLVVYGIFSMTTKKDKENKKDTKKIKEEIKFDYDKELDLVDNFVLDEDFKFDNNLKMRFVISNLKETDYKKTNSSFNDIKYYTFSGFYIKAGTLKKYLNDLFGKNNYELNSFYVNDSYYLYDKNDKCFYVFTSTLVTNCANSGDVVTNCIELEETYCHPEYSQDDSSIIVNVTCTDDRRYIKAEPSSIKNRYSYKYIYSYDNKENDYYISNIKLIKE